MFEDTRVRRRGVIRTARARWRNLIPYRLEREPSHAVRRRMIARVAPRRLVDRVPDCPTVNNPWLRWIVAFRGRASLRRRLLEHDGAAALVAHGVIFIEHAGVLGAGVQQPSRRRPGLAVHRMRVRRRDDVGSSGVDRRVDGERRRSRAVTCPPTPSENRSGRRAGARARHLLLPVQPLLLHVGERRRGGHDQSALPLLERPGLVRCLRESVCHGPKLSSAHGLPHRRDP